MHLPERRAKHANLAGLLGMTICQVDIVRQIATGMYISDS
jgi:hypothetical protein